jgi:HlyD family secretion protein
MTLCARRWSVAIAGIVIVVAVVLGVTDPLGGDNPVTTGVSDNGYPTSATIVTRGPIAAQLNASGTIEYTASEGSGHNIDVINRAAGTFTELPAVGETVSRGQVLYRVSNDPVILLYGDTPVYRSLFEGDTGPDVRELNANLVALGYATRSELDTSSDYFSHETAYALELLQSKLGEDESGSLTEGQAAFLPGQARIATVSVTLGANAGPGAPIMQVTSTSRQVLVDLDASEQTEVEVGDQVQITLPDGDNTPGVVSAIGTVATSGSSGATLPLYITLDHAKAAGTLDQAPVAVEITTATVERALIVPVDALLALGGGGYAVETISGQGIHQLVAVTLGTFDDADGTVQVTGDLHAGERIVVPNL